MVRVRDLRASTPRTNGTRRLSVIKNIARHHSATTDGNWASFWRYWNGTLGWGTGGYHEIILRDGTVELCYDPHEITNGVGGQNSYIYNICLVGSGSFTDAQEKAFEKRAKYWMEKFNLPVSAVKGHNEFPKQSTNCPGINMNEVRARLSRAEKPVVKPKEVDVMAEQLPKTQQDDMRELLTKAYNTRDDKGKRIFSVDHTSKVDKMTRGQALDLLISYVARTK